MPTEVTGPTPNRSNLIRDVVVFQFKLIVDGFRDLMLVPISLVAGLMSLVGGSSRKDNAFYEVMRQGKRSERLINLFGAVEAMDQDPEEDEELAGIDELASRVENFLIEEYRNGGITAQAKTRLDDVVNALKKWRSKRDIPE